MSTPREKRVKERKTFYKEILGPRYISVIAAHLKEINFKTTTGLDWTRQNVYSQLEKYELNPNLELQILDFCEKKQRTEKELKQKRKKLTEASK